MNDTPVSSAREPGSPRWLLLMHQLPVEPAYVRVKVRRRLARLGAFALKNSVYVLPWSDEHLEDLAWLANEIVADGGEATVCAASFLIGLTDEEVSQQFPAAMTVGARPQRLAEMDRPRAATWVTRKGVFVDRIASAWLIRRFIDPEAKFRFAMGEKARKAPGELRFDMFEGEFTHVGDRCTFEVLVERFGLADDAALVAIGEIVHDIDLKDDKYDRVETAGVRTMLTGIAEETRDDMERISRGSALLDALYQSLSSSRRDD